jgi:PAS domain S-box-containing protein
MAAARPRAWAYARGVLLGAAAAGITTVAAHMLHAPLLLVGVGAVALAAVLGGTGPGLAAEGVVLVWGAASASTAQEVARLTVFAVVAALVARTTGWSRAILERSIATRRDAARSLRGRLDFHRAIARAMDEGVYALDRAGRITYLNAAAERMLGYRAGELVGKPMKQALRCRRVESPCSGNGCRVLAVMQTGEPFRAADDVLTRKDGTCFPVRYSSAPIVRTGEVVGAAVVFQDVSSERRAAARERFLAAATEQLADSIDWDETLARVARLAMPFLGDWCMVVLVDDEGVARPVAFESNDASRAEVAREMLARYPVDLEAEHGVGRVLRTGEPELLPEVQDFAGREGPTVRERAELLARLGLRSFMAVPLSARGRILGVLDFGIAASDRRFGPEDLDVARELARRCALALDNARLHRKIQAAVRARENTLAIVSHDLRNPLSAIRLATAVLERQPASREGGEGVRRAAASILRGTDRMDRLIRDLVDLASIDSGRLSVFRRRLAPEEIAADAIEAIRPLASEARVAVTLEPAPGAPCVDADAERVQQVLVNLLSNAVKVTPACGEVRLRYRARRREVVFSVIDAGPGVAREHRDRVFERYWRGVHVPYRGTGLGLSIARGIVEAHGGRLWVSSRPGAGATFRFTLPAAAADADAGRRPPSAAPFTGARS